MELKQRLQLDEDTLSQVAGITGLGWTASLLGYLGAVLGYGTTLVTNPLSLLYLGGVLLVATLGLDQLKKTLSDRTE
jgi:hypothetical protein